MEGKMRKSKLMDVLSLTLFSVGILLGLVLISITVWADLEATLFNPQPRQYAPSFRRLRCPIVITPEETATIRARFKNTLDREIDLFIRAHISHGYVTLRREVINELSLDPGEAKWVEWEVDKEDAAFERLILFRMIRRGGYPLASRQGTCGIVLMNVPYLTGNQIVIALLAGNLIFMIAGGVLWIVPNRHMLDIQAQLTRAMGFLAGCILIGILLSFLGWWVPGVAFLVVILLGIGVVIGYFVNVDNT